MSLPPTDQFGSAEFDQSQFLQFEIPELGDYDFSTFAMPSVSPWAPLPIGEVVTTQNAVQSPKPKTPVYSPPPQPRRASVVTIQRRSSSNLNEGRLTVTLEAPNGKKRSWNVKFDSAFEAWFNKSPVENIWPSMQPPAAMAQPPVHAPQPRMSLDHQFPLGPSYSSINQVIYPVAVHDQATTQVPSVPSYQPVPKLSQPPVGFAGRAGRVPVSTRISPRQAKRPASIDNEQNASQRAQHAPSRISQKPSYGGRPPLPDDLVPLLNPHHLPSNHGRVPDKRGNKDTTMANDYYYSVRKLDNLFLPTCEETVSYNGVEFDADLSFTSQAFREYLQCASQRPNRQPILRIQIQPAQYNHRYMRAGQSFKCRFRDCPDKRGTILKGQARVCISEFDDEHGDWLNPFHNAGYVHLFCLEKQTNFIELCNDFPGITVVPETRSLAHEPPATTNMRLNNPMALNDVERAVVAEWLAEIGTRWNTFKATHRDRTLRPKFELAQKDTLTYRLTKAHMDNRQLRSVQTKRKRDAGDRVTAHLNEHVGDVSKQVALQKKMKKQPPPPSKRQESISGGITRETETASPEPALKRQRVTSATSTTSPLFSPSISAPSPTVIVASSDA